MRPLGGEPSFRRAIQSVEADPRVQKYSPRFVGEGSSQVVFESPKHPSVVLKVEKRILRKIIENIHNAGYKPDGIPEQYGVLLAEAIERRRKTEEEAFRTFQRIYGSPSILMERFRFEHLPVNRTVLRELYGDAPFLEDYKETSVDLPVPLRIQEKVPDHVSKGMYMSVHTIAAEGAEVGYTRRAYIRDSMDLLLGDGRQAHTYLRSIWRAWSAFEVTAEDTPSAQRALRSFVENTFRLSKETGYIIDTQGSGNVLLYDGGTPNWNVLLVDPLKPFTSPQDFPVALAALKDVREKVPDARDAEHAWQLRLLLNYTRFFNALAAVVKSPERFRLDLGAQPEHLLEDLYSFVKPT